MSRSKRYGAMGAQSDRLPRGRPLRQRRWLWTVLLTATGLLLSGCMVGPDYHSPQTKVSPDWAAPTTFPATTQASAATTQPVEIVQWWTTFGDPTLNSLVGRAVGSNLTLMQAESRIRQARAQRIIAASGLWPSINATGNYRRFFNGNGNSGPQPSPQDLYQVGLDASWELDVFGGVRRGVEAATANIEARIEDRNDVIVSLVSEVALDYVDLRGLQQQIVIAQQNLTAQQRTAALTRQQFQGGFASRLDVANAEAQVATTESTIPVFESAAQQTIYALSVLLGEEPGALQQELAPTGEIPGTPPLVPVGLPSDLLRRRPDIRRAEAQLHIATANIGVATADLFPRFSLTGTVGVAASDFASLGNWANRFWSIGPNANWSIFNAGAVRANIQVQNEVQQQALLAYHQTILAALQDVNSALVAYAREQQHREILARAVAANTQAVSLALQLYTQGQTDFLNVLTAQRSLYASQDALVQSTRTVCTDLVALYKALGGGWEIDQSAAQAAAATTQPTTTATTRPTTTKP